MTWLLALAFAEEQAEIVVRAHQTVLEAEAALHEDIREMGYWPGISLPGRTRYVHPQIWKPAVTVHDEGFVRVKAHAVTVFFGGATPTNVWATGIWGNPGQARASEERVLTGIHPELLDWREALTAYGLALRREALVLELTELEELPAAVARAAKSGVARRACPVGGTNPASARR